LRNQAVLDASVALSWVLPGEDSNLTLPLRDRAAEIPGFELFVPPLFYFEIGNALWAARRRKRISRATAEQALEAILDFNFTLLMPDPAKCLQIALDHDLSVYDAAYLAVALGKTKLLWTIDRTLAKTARNLKIRTEPA